METNYLQAMCGGCGFGGRGNSDKNFTKRGAKAREAWEMWKRLVTWSVMRTWPSCRAGRCQRRACEFAAHGKCCL